MADLESFQHPLYARLYMRLAASVERHGGHAHRARLVRGLAGRVIEIGAGHGPNFKYYPSAVTEVLAVEPENTLRRHAKAAAAAAPVVVTVVAGHVEELPAAAGSMDAAVVSFVLCSVPDPVRALVEIARVLRPDGELRFYEHVRSPRPAMGFVQDLITPLWSRTAGGCRPNRDTGTVLRTTGFRIDELDRIPFGLTLILGRAHKR